MSVLYQEGITLIVYRPEERRRIQVLTVIFMLGLVFPSAGWAQMEILRSLGPDLGKARVSLQYQITPYSNEEVEGQGKKFQSTSHSASLATPLSQDSNHEWTMIGILRLKQVETAALLPDTGESFPETLWDIRLGSQYRHRFSNGWIGGGGIQIGSASDQPFKSEAEVTAQATLFARIPAAEKDSWLIFLNYSRYREFLPHVPIPGFAYSYEPSSQVRLIAGIPFSFVEWKPTKNLSLELFYFLVRTVQAKVTYRLRPAWQIYGSFEWRSEYSFRYDRKEKNDRLSYYEKKLAAGMGWNFSGGNFIDIGGGYAFDRFYFEGEGYDDRDQNRFNLGNGFFAQLRVGFFF